MSGRLDEGVGRRLQGIIRGRWYPLFHTSSPKVRCVETMLNVNIGMNNQQLLAGGVPKHKINGVHAMAPAVKAAAAPYRLTFVGDKAGHAALDEPVFQAWENVGGILLFDDDDEGNQLFVESMMPENKERFPLGSFRYQATVAMSWAHYDLRIKEKPEAIAWRGLGYLVPQLVGGRNRVAQGATHTFGIEALFNGVRGVPMGQDGNELYQNAEGGFDEAGFFEVRVMYDASKDRFADQMQVARTMSLDNKGEEGYDGKKLLEPEQISTETLMQYM